MTDQKPSNVVSLPGASSAAMRVEEQFADAKPLYSSGEALAEALRCLYCYDAPCIGACPTGIDIPTFIKKIATGNLRGSAKTILDANLLGYSCGAVCPVEVLCAGACVYNNRDAPPIQIGRLQRYATAHVLDQGVPAYRPKPKIGRRVALVGAGPASLSCSGVLALEGVEAILYEQRPLAGGLNTTGVAPYKLTMSESLREVDFIRSLGVEIRTGVTVGRDVSHADLLRDYDAVFVGVGLGADTRLGIPGEQGEGLWGATEWIERMKTDARFALGQIASAAVVGGGNTALDVAQELALLGVRQVALIYRRSRGEMSGYDHELAHALELGVQLHDNAMPIAVMRNAAGQVTGLRLARAVGGRPSNDLMSDLMCELVVVAIGQSRLGELVAGFGSVALDHGRIVVDAATGRTGNSKVYAGGDCANGGKEVVNAVQEGKLAARAMIRSWR